MPTRVVITGATGNVGTALLRRLADDSGDYEVCGIARRRPPAEDIYRWARWEQADLTDPAASAKLEPLFRGADCIVHLAWGFQPTRNVEYLDSVAVGGTRAVLRAAHAAAVPHLLHMSSVGTYAAGSYGKRVDETWSTAGIPTSAYSRGKSAAEALLDDYERRHRDGMTITRMRPGLVLQRDAASGIRRYMLPAYLDPRWLRMLPVLPLDRSFTVAVVHTDDVADACVRAIQQRAPGAFNLAAEPPVRRDDIAHALGAKPVHVPAAVMRPLVQASWLARLQPIDQGWFDLAFSVPLLSTERARAVLGWSPRWTSAETLADIGRGFANGAGTKSPVLNRRSLRQALSRDITRGPITTRPEP